jgi:hypothetical protein
MQGSFGWRLWGLSVSMGAVFALAACSGSEDSPAGQQNGNAGAPGGGGEGGEPGLPSVRGEPDTSVQTTLPPLPHMENVTATAIGDSVDIQFFPIDGAVDYRVYVLPKDEDVSSDGSGHVTVKNAVYRCSGDRQSQPAAIEGVKPTRCLCSGTGCDGCQSHGAINTFVDNADVEGFTRQLADATLGYVWASPGDGRVPVYALGNPDADGDNSCYYQRWTASRSKVYTTSDTERADMIGKNWRDDGIVFYVPSAADASTHTLYTSTAKGGSGRESRYYFIDGPEAAARGGKTPAFEVLTDGSADDVHPLMRVFYQNVCGMSHDELAAGESQFDRVYKQGDQVPYFGLHWSGITAETTLVVEALADGCPYPGFLGAKSSPQYTDDVGRTFPAWMTLDELQKASPTGEVYINGQHDRPTPPRPIARSFVKISPGPKPDMDWFMGFESPDVLGTLTEPPCAEPNGGNCRQEFRQTSDTLDTIFMNVETDRWAMAPFLGELWLTYDDVAADVNGKFRLTPTQKAQMSADTYLHATMTTDAFTTNRRYPQIMISDSELPIQWHMADANTLIIESFLDWPAKFLVEVCDHRLWDVNQQCPAFDMYHLNDPNDDTKVIGLAPNDEVSEHLAMDRSTRFDVYVSTQRAYLFLDGQPYGCGNLPAAGVPSGPVTVTFGDVLYHSDADHTFLYTGAKLQHETRRHFDNLGFKSGVPAPPWNEARFPCRSTLGAAL